MVKRSQKIRLGIFLTASISLLLISIILVSSMKLFEKRDVYFIRYKDTTVSGLDVGSQVRYHGIRIGRVDEISIDQEDITSVIVKVSLKAGTPIKNDTEAVITFLGITGLKVIELRGGTQEAQNIPKKFFIKAGVSMEQAITGKAEVITEKLELVLNNLSELTKPDQTGNLGDLIKNMAASMKALTGLLEENQAPLAESMKGIAPLLSETRNTVEAANEVFENLGSFIESADMTESAGNIRQITENIRELNLKETIENFNSTMTKASETLTHLDLTLLKSRQDIFHALESLNESLENLNEFSRMIRENPSLLIRGEMQEEIPEK